MRLPRRQLSGGALQLQRLFGRRRHPGFNLFRFGEDHRHGLGVDGPDFGVQLGCQEAEQVVGGLSLLDLPD